MKLQLKPHEASLHLEASDLHLSNICLKDKFEEPILDAYWFHCCEGFLSFCLKLGLRI